MKKILQQFVPVFCLFIIALPAYADGTHPRGIKTDGSVGSAGSLDLPGPDYRIRAEYGHQAGANLFHSFQQFNIHTDETATFTGPDSVQNIISRVTGGDPSWIDGKLASAAPNADIWFLNPAGLIFGPSASLDLPGSFHAGTGDYLRMGENQRFYAQPLHNEVLSVAPPAAFGFLTEVPAPIIIRESTLSVSEGKALSLSGGGLEMNGTPPADNETGEAEYVSGLYAESGEISLVSVASSGEVAPGPGGTDLSDPTQGGSFTANHVRIDVSGKRGGCIFIHAGDIEVTASQVISKTSGDQDGRVTEIHAENMILNESAEIASITEGSGDSGDIALFVADTLTISDGHIKGHSFGTEPDAGSGGQIEIEADRIILTDKGDIASGTYGLGEAGTITIRVSDTLTISGKNEKPDRTGIKANTHSTLPEAGNGGRVEIEADRIIITDGGHVASDTFGAGDSGSVLLNAWHTLEVSGGKIMSMSGIPGGEGTGDEGTSDSQAGQDPGATEPITNPEDSQMPTGNAGHIEIRADQISLTNDAEIATFTTGIGQGGTIHIIAGDMRVSESEISAYSQSEEPGAGQAGNIEVESDTVHLLNRGIITAETANAAGGNMIFEIPGFLYLFGGQITTSVQGGAGDGGNITVRGPEFAVLNKGRIRANAYEGRGGNIRITAEQFLQSSDSRVEASSEKGIDGTVRIESPETDVGNGLTVLPETYLDASNWSKTPCSQRTGENMSRFIIKGRDAVPTAPDDLLTSPLR
ncbi:MAG: hypothetical protein DRI57_08210 [Deltaproteobacteria bacterium]|nr:MAG: hypothetical protein DRI57_08210 [Deltaproteobacteria bacterium]